jgi:uncharacterized membrane protein
MELTFEVGGWWSYVLVFVAAATPVLEVLVVVPAGMLAGMAPVPTALVAVAGNLSTVVLVTVAGDRLLGWWRGWSEKERQVSPRSQRAQVLAQRWGVPGLAFLAPITTGTHIASVAALATGSDTRRVLRWMAAGLVVWAAVVAVVTAAGIDEFA